MATVPVLDLDRTNHQVPTCLCQAVIAKLHPGNGSYTALLQAVISAKMGTSPADFSVSTHFFILLNHNTNGFNV